MDAERNGLMVMILRLVDNADAFHSRRIALILWNKSTSGMELLMESAFPASFFPRKGIHQFIMADSYTIKNAQQKFSAVVQEAADHPVTITNQGRAVAVVMSIERLEAISETMELLADPKAMAAIRKHREGRAIYHDLAVLDDL